MRIRCRDGRHRRKRTQLYPFPVSEEDKEAKEEAQMGLLMDHKSEAGEVAKNILHFCVIFFVAATVSAVTDAVKENPPGFCHPILEVSPPPPPPSPVTVAAGVAGNVTSRLNPCDSDTPWNSADVRSGLVLWLRGLATLPHFRHSLHLPITLQQEDQGDRRGLLVVQFFEQKVPQVHLVGLASTPHKFSGPVWMSGGPSEEMEFANGFYYGRLKDDGALTGEDISFVFPDFRTVLKGRFENGYMKEARPARIKAERCHGGIKQLKISSIKETANVEAYHYQPPTALRPGGQPTLMDPMEKRNVYVADSPGKGLGVFAKRDIKKGEIICYFAGTVHDLESYNSAASNLTEEEIYTLHKYALSLFTNESVLNIPTEFIGLHRFRATLGHFINHSFLRDMSEWILVAHPRFGYIRAVLATDNIRKGEEIFINYRYPIEDPGTPKWYKELYEDEVVHGKEKPS